MEIDNPQPDHETLACSKWEDKWEVLKPTMEFWYFDKKLSVAKLAEKMKENFGFTAFEHQYKHKFTKWGWKKNLRAKEKTKIERILVTRANLGRSSVIEDLGGRRIDSEKIRRHAKNKKRQEMILRDRSPGAVGNFLTEMKLDFGNLLFLDWSMALRAFAFGASYHPSPHSPASPPIGILIRSPSNGCSPSTRRPGANKMIPDIMKQASLERAQLLVQGKYGQLLKSLTTSEAQVMASWISQFQMYAFATAKHWGRGPRAWTARELEPFAYRSSDGEMPEDIKSPPPLCRWTIHIYEQYEYDEDDWPAEWYDVPIQERLRNALEHNDFTNIRPSDLPVALPAIAKTATRQPNELFLESLRLAIMTRNLELVSQLVPKLTKGDLATHMTSLLHLAVGYLDGCEACCSILHCLLRRDYPRYHDYINDKGYTLLDSLMATIVKSHTDLRPSILDEFNKESLFPGDEVSTCGRWDVDADCIQQMRLAGQKRVPWSWKHKFCHTSAQAICHSMEAVLKQSVRPYTSGLFRKLCTNCGLKLQLHPLHTLVKVTFLIAEAGCAEEDLFGMTACLLMLLAYYEDAKPKASVSLTLLFDGELDTTMETCMHQKFSPSELACALRKYRRQCWTKKLETGWRLFQLLLTRAEKAADQLDEAWDRYEENGEKGPEPPEGYCHEHEFEGPLTRDETLRTVWAAVQTEFLTYRRINLDDPWISDKFDMEELLQSLQNGRTPSIGLIRDGLRKPLCECGNFDMSRPATAEDVSAKHFSNFSDIHDERCTEI